MTSRERRVRIRARQHRETKARTPKIGVRTAPGRKRWTQKPMTSAIDVSAIENTPQALSRSEFTTTTHRRGATTMTNTIAIAVAVR